MPEKTITAIMMAALPTKTEYVVGFKGLDLTGGLLNLVYSDGTFEQVPLSEKMDYFTDNTKVGPSNVTVQYAGLTTGFRIMVREPALCKVTIIAPPNKTSYMEGEMLDLTGLRLMGHYDNGTEKEIASIPTISHRTQLGEAVVPLSIEHLFIPILIQVLPSQPIGISMRNMPKKTIYMEGIESLDVAGGMLEKKLANGRIELVPLTLDMVTGFDNTKVGKQTLTATYGSQNCQFDVEVVAKRCEHLELYSLPFKRSYIEGEHFDLLGIRLIAKKDGLTWEPTLDELTTKKPTAEANDINMVVCYQEQSIEVPITIIKKQLTGISVHTLPMVTTYKETELGTSISINADGGVLCLQYDNGETDFIPMADAEIPPIIPTGVGKQQVTIMYQSCETVFEVTIEPQKLLGIYISQQPTKTAYTAGELFDAAGMAVSAIYDNGKTSVVDRYTFPTQPLAETDASVIITYIDKTAIVPITVQTKTPSAVKLQRRAPLPQVKTMERFYPGTIGLRFGAE